MTEPKKEKNSERLEIRLPYSKKQAFMDACENQSDTPSHAIRRFINSYIRRTDSDEIGHWFGALKRRLRPVSLLALLVVSISGLAIWNSQKSEPNVIDKAALFAAYDKDQSGFIERGEIATGANDIHLFEVLNNDGDDLISLDEFMPNGEIAWMYNENEMTEDDQSVSFQNSGLVHFVQFDFTNIDDPFIVVWSKDPNDEKFSFRADVVKVKPLPANVADMIK